MRWLILLLALVIGAHPAEARRVALVIGNATYAHASTLSSPHLDADAIEAAFKRMKFDAVIRLKDLGVKPMADAFSAFRREATGADVAVIYYSGHGIEIDGVNYLIPIDAKLDDPFDAGLQAIALPVVMRQLDGSRRLRVVILDACRDNPFQQRLSQLPGRKNISIGKGFVAVREADLAQRTLVAFAAREGTTAEDRRGRLSTYTDALVKYIEKPGLEIRLLFGQVRDEVIRETNGRQQPHEYLSLGGEALYLGAPPAPPTAVEQPSAPPPGQIRLSEAAEAWAATKDTTNIAVLEAFLARYKDTFFADLARARIEELKKHQVALAVPPKAPVAPSVIQREEQPPHWPSATTPMARCDGVETEVGSERRCLKPKDTYKDCPECPEMVVIPAGEFMMGSNDGGVQRETHPQGDDRQAVCGRQVRGDVCGVGCVRGGRRLQAQARGSGWGRGNRPVINVSWDDATKEYLPWLSRKTGKTYRLLTEAEWEYAARGVTSASAVHTTYSWGNDIGKNRANCDGCGSQWDDKQTAPVGSFAANAFGLHDMHGNVWEWVQDCYKDTYAGAPPDGRATSDVASCLRVLRGGSWGNGAAGPPLRQPQLVPAHRPQRLRRLPCCQNALTSFVFVSLRLEHGGYHVAGWGS